MELAYSLSMQGEEIKKQIGEWAKTVEYRHALVTLVVAGLSPATAEMLIKGTYVSTPKGRTVDILKKVLAQETKAS